MYPEIPGYLRGLLLGEAVGKVHVAMHKEVFLSASVSGSGGDAMISNLFV